MLYIVCMKFDDVSRETGGCYRDLFTDGAFEQMIMLFVASLQPIFSILKFEDAPN